MMRFGLGAAAACLLISSASAAPYDVTEKSIAQLQADLASGHITSAGIVSAYVQDIFVAAQKTKGLSDPAYLKARALLMRVSRAELDHILGSYKLDALVMPTDEPAWRVDVVKGDNDASNTSFLPAVAGYPHLTVPMGFIRELPVGISFIGSTWSEAKLLALGAAFEAVTHARHAPKYIPSIESTLPVTKYTAPMRRAGDVAL